MKTLVAAAFQGSYHVISNRRKYG